MFDISNQNQPDFAFVSDLMNGQALAPDGSNTVMAEWEAEGTSPGAVPLPIAPLHIHHLDDEAWYVLEGSLGFQVGDKAMQANAGEAVIVPRGTPHTYWNPGSDSARYLIIMTLRIRDLIDAIHRTDERDPASMKRLFEQFESEWLG